MTVLASETCDHSVISIIDTIYDIVFETLGAACFSETASCRVQMKGIRKDLLDRDVHREEERRGEEKREEERGGY